MAEEWFVRVGEKDYGPVDLETLREWKSEGRLLAENPVRRRDETTWSTAGQIPDLFAPEPPPEVAPNELFHRRSFGAIVRESFRIYRQGFWQFFLLALFVALPSLGLKISLAYVNFREGEITTASTRVASAIAMIMLAALVAAWPIFLGGLQFVAEACAENRSVRFGEILRRAINFWPRIIRLCLFVYGSYIFWTILPLLVILMLASTPSLGSTFFALVALAFQVFMAGRLFINFMFWQQSSTIGRLDGVEALRESRDLARSRAEMPRWQRPLYRGAIIASIWLLILLALSVAIEFPFMLVRLEGITTFDQAYAMMQSMMNAPAPDAMTLATYVLDSLAHALLRPLLGIAFVVLYFDARSTR